MIVIAIAFSVGLLLIGITILAVTKGRSQISLQSRKKVHSWFLDTQGNQEILSKIGKRSLWFCFQRDFARWKYYSSEEA